MKYKDFRHPQLVYGYLGLEENDLTLNASFFYTLFKEKTNFDDMIIFPQRIPQMDFFEEIHQAQNPAIQLELEKRKREFYLNAINSADNSNHRIFINWLNILLRYGCFDEILRTTQLISNNLDVNDSLEYNLIIEITKQKLLHGNESKDINGLENLAESVLDKDNSSIRIRVLVLNFIIVSNYRFGYKLNDVLLTKCVEQLIFLVDSLADDFGSVIRKSVAYRGLAMVDYFDNQQEQKCMSLAETFARNAIPKSTLQVIVARENLVTCLQTLSKWNIHNNNIKLAEESLIEMISLDPNDSTGYAEMGFLLFNHNRIDEAATFFQKAANAGPPAVGMHLYYYAKCLLILNRGDDAEKILYESIEIDPFAITPCLELVSYYQSSGKLSNAKKIISMILSESKYRDQLTSDEILILMD
jgi:tetratricopeptide (TPR) repeat protein